MDKKKDIRDMVQQAYASVARQQSGCCCGPQSCCGSPAAAPMEKGLPQADLGLSCGDPVTFAAVRPGDVVVDLGSGAGRDVFIAARIVGASGRVIGVDMTDDMLALARYIEALPVADAEADVVISNCVINLSPDKAAVFREVFRVLKPGGRMIVSDIVLNRDLPPALRNNDALYAGCIAGALRREDYLEAIRTAGFAQVEILNDVTYTAGGSITDPVTREVGDELAGVASSLTIRAVKA